MKPAVNLVLIALLPGILTAVPEALAEKLAAPHFAGMKAGETREIDGIRLCWCPPGTYIMGSPPGEPGHLRVERRVKVTLTTGFWIGKFEVTQGVWKRVMNSLPPVLDKGAGEDYPVYNVNFPQVQRFCRRLTFRLHCSGLLPEDWEFVLPTEAQWEYACRAGTKTATAFGNTLSSRQANFRGDFPYNGAETGPSLNRTERVGAYPPNPWNICDMHGNVFEWCRDWFHPRLRGGTDPDLSTDKARSRVRRGGCWADEGWPCRSAFRLAFEPGRAHSHIGFRVIAIQR